MDHTQKCDALKALFEGELGTLKALSERSFSTTLQALTLNLAVVAGLVAGKVTLSTDGKLIGSILLFVFNFLVGSYLLSKSRAHHREKLRLKQIQASLADVAGINLSDPSDKPSFWRSFFGGSGIFILAVTIAAACSIFAMWVSLLQQD